MERLSKAGRRFLWLFHSNGLVLARAGGITTNGDMSRENRFKSRSSRWFLFRGGQPSFYHNRVTTEFSAPFFPILYDVCPCLTDDIFSHEFLICFCERELLSFRLNDYLKNDKCFVYVYISNHGVYSRDSLEWNFTQLSRKLRNSLYNKKQDQVVKERP